MGNEKRFGEGKYSANNEETVNTAEENKTENTKKEKNKIKASAKKNTKENDTKKAEKVKSKSDKENTELTNNKKMEESDENLKTDEKKSLKENNIKEAENEYSENKSEGKKKKSKKQSKVKTFIKRACICVGTFLILIIAGLFTGMGIICYGPSDAAKNIFVISVLETSAAKFLAYTYFSEEEVEQIIADNTLVVFKDVTDTDLVEIPNEDENPEFDLNAIEVVDVSGSTYRGKMMIVNDPSRVCVGVSGAFGDGAVGKTVSDIVESYGAVAGINAGGFMDNGGIGNGGTPVGLVISEGKLLWGSSSSYYEIIGMSNENKLVVGTLSGQEALDMGIRDAVCFGPALIVNGEAAAVSGTGSGLNPRSAIGQRADGAILLLCIDGRMANSLGASYADIIYEMEQFGAINAANLDGGSSSVLVYEGEIINTCSSLYGPRKLPTTIIVK